MEVTEVLVLAVLLHGASTQHCPSSRTTNLSLSMAGRRNVSGHWLISVSAWTRGPRSSPGVNRQQRIALDAEQSETSCGDSESVHMVSTATVSPSPPDDYELVNGLGYYKLHATAKTWEDARDTCAGEGAQLIVINSDAEADVVRTYWSRKPAIPDATNDVYTHVGFHDRYVEGQYITLTGESLESSGYARWDKNKPNKLENQDCGLATRDVKYHDGPCQWKLFFVCELLGG